MDPDPAGSSFSGSGIDPDPAGSSYLGSRSGRIRKLWIRCTSSFVYGKLGHIVYFNIRVVSDVYECRVSRLKLTIVLEKIVYLIFVCNAAVLMMDPLQCYRLINGL